MASHPELPIITALSLGGLRRQINERLIGEDVDVRLTLDRAARRERDARRHGGQRDNAAPETVWGDEAAN